MLRVGGQRNRFLLVLSCARYQLETWKWEHSGPKYNGNRAATPYPAEGLVHQHAPHAVVVDVVGGDATLLPYIPQLDRAVRTSREALRDKGQGSF